MSAISSFSKEELTKRTTCLTRRKKTLEHRTDGGRQTDRSVDVGVVEVVLEGVEEVGVGELVIGADWTFAEHLECFDVVHVHSHRRVRIF
ncbi:hypothetical protein Vadar_005434 [Vaccinium darrowii]|uniref:Uncharacterized protein n=1 Tax=Vaccinium darrowii TaxID=229202 RepID=A0ACB7WYL9_9ERIC|nr:hypothetical protein Vadar_005434 [Vaccinium darrowii]